MTNNTHNNMVLTKNGLVYYTLKKTKTKKNTERKQNQEQLKDNKN